LSDDELHRLFRACDRTRHPHRNRAILYTLLETGVRASELCLDAERPKEETGLLMENLILGRGTESYIRVIGKGSKVRTVPIGDATRQIVQKYLNRERPNKENPYVFLAQGGLPLSVKRLEETLHVLGDHAGIEDVHPHRFRHTFAVNQLIAGTSSFVLMQLMGHTTLEATKTYTRALTQLQSRRAATSVVDEMKKRRATN
jgi:integrase/recombinase XerD